jgi:hypothetical protein
MPFGMGRQGWDYVHPWHHHGCHHWHCGPAFYDWPAAAAYWPSLGAASRDQELALLQDEARVLEEELSQIKKRLEEIKQ